MRQRLEKRREAGATAMEYLIIVVVVAIGLLVAWRNFGNSIVSKISEAEGSVNSLRVDVDE